MKRIISVVLFLLFAVVFACTGLGQGSAPYLPATVDAGNADKVHLRAGPSAEAASLGLYFTGTDVLCGVSPSAEWSRVVIGAESGYIKSQYLKLGNDGERVASQEPTGVVKTKSWVNFRNAPSLQAESIAKLHDGDTMVVHGETASHWYYATVGGTDGYVKTDYVRLSSSSSGSATTPTQNAEQKSSSANPQRVTERIDPQDSLEAYVTVSSCYVALIPTEDRFVTCEYDASQLRFSHRIERGSHILTLESAGSASSAPYPAATLRIPKDFYHQIYLDVRGGEGSVSGGFQCYRNVYGTNARFSLTLAENDAFGYDIALTDSVCVMGISEIAENYSIAIESIVDGSVVVPAYGMPSCQPGASSYAYTNGTGAAKIHATRLSNSDMEFTYTKPEN